MGLVERWIFRIFSSPIDSVVYYAITTLHNLLQHLPGAKDQVRVAGGVAKMVALLQKRQDKFLAINTDCLHLLAFEHPETKVIYFVFGVSQVVLQQRPADRGFLLFKVARKQSSIFYVPWH